MNCQIKEELARLVNLLAQERLDPATAVTCVEPLKQLVTGIQYFAQSSPVSNGELEALVRELEDIKYSFEQSVDRANELRGKLDRYKQDLHMIQSEIEALERLRELHQWRDALMEQLQDCRAQAEVLSEATIRAPENDRKTLEDLADKTKTLINNAEEHIEEQRKILNETTKKASEEWEKWRHRVFVSPTRQ